MREVNYRPPATVSYLTIRNAFMIVRHQRPHITWLVKMHSFIIGIPNFIHAYKTHSVLSRL